LYRKSFRDVVRELAGEPVSFVKMEVSKEEVLARNMPRVTSFCKESGMTEAEAWKTWGAEKEFGPFTGPADWNKFLVGANIFAGM